MISFSLKWKHFLSFLGVLSIVILPVIGWGQTPTHQQISGTVSASWIRKNVTENPVTAAWIKEHLSEQSPKLVLTESRETLLESKLKNDGPVAAYYEYLKKMADQIIGKPVLKREKVGKRLLGVSRDAVLRIGTLALVYRIERKGQYLDRLAEELDAVSNFSDWNPSHFLDVAEMSYAVAIGLDWAGQWLPDETVENARSALEKHLRISLEDNDYNWWINSEHNWNQVCHAGLSAAAIVLADEQPTLAAAILSRAVDKLPLALAAYSPDGAYPEGPTYWDYGTSYNLLALSFFESAFGTDFNLSKSPGFMESAIYRMVVVAPSGQSFNYGDAGYGSLDLGTRGNLSWFGQKTGNSLYLDKEAMLPLIQQAAADRDTPSRLAPAYLIWLAQFENNKSGKLPTYWKADGPNPIAIMGSEEDESHGFYLGIKGGSPSVNHGNMDAGSFIFELNGVRWAVDPGTQGYNELEQIMGNELWNQGQDSRRWSLLTKGNQYHSTLTVNEARHNADGYAPITEFQTAGNSKWVSIDMTDIFANQLNQSNRTFRKMDGQTLRVEDQFIPEDKTNKVTWTMVTQAEVKTTEQGAVLFQDEKTLNLQIIEPKSTNVSITSLNPLPLSYDKNIEGLKRIEINIPGYLLKEGTNRIVVVLKSNQ